MINNLDKLTKDLNSKFFFNHNMSNHTWYRTGGNADMFCIVDNQKELEVILSSLEANVPLFIIGMGSNVLVRDGGFKGVIIKLVTDGM